MQFVSSHRDNKIVRQVKGNITYFFFKSHIMNFLSSCNGIWIPESGKFLLVEKNQVGKFNVSFIHKNNQVQFVFVEELSI